MKIQIVISTILLSCFFLISCSPSTEGLYIKASRLENKKRYKEAIKVYDRIIQRNPRLQDAIFEKAYCFLQDSNYTQALHFFEQTLSLKLIGNFIFEENPDNPFASEESKHQIPISHIYYQIGVAQYYIGSLIKSNSNFQNSIDHGYETANCLIWQGMIWVRSDSVEKACNFFQKAKNLGEINADGLIKLHCQKQIEK